jgi:hypothetical protein
MPCARRHPGAVGKSRVPGCRTEPLNIDLHHDFKRAHGYSDLEIAGKRDSLENVLVPESLDEHRNRLRRAAFAQAMSGSSVLTLHRSSR